MTVTQSRMTAAEIAERGKTIYQTQLRPLLERDDFGKYLVIDIVTGNYEIGQTHLETARRARASRPDAVLYGMRIGYPAVASFGAALRTEKEQHG